MGGGLLEWRWGRTANQQAGGGVGNKKEKSATRKKSTRRVRFKEGSSGALRIGDAGSGAAPGGGGVVQGKEKKRVWFSRIWLSIRRKEGRGARRQTAPEKGIELPSEYFDIVSITVSQLPRSSSFTRVSSCQVSIPTFLSPNGTRFARSHFRAQKSHDFQGPPLLMPLVMDLARLKTIAYRAI
jgi:hypothetical protein